MKFVDQSTNELSSVTVGQHFIDTERLLLTDRLRYDSPTIGSGMQVSGTIAADSRWDTAIRYYPLYDDWAIRVAATYQHKPFRDIQNRFDLGFSARHNETGLNLTIGLTRGKATDGREATGYVTKAGWLTHLNSLGYTAFSVDYSSGNSIFEEGDQTSSYGVFAQQKWDTVGVDLYGGIRRYDVTRTDIALKPLKVFVLGVIYSF